MRSPLIAGNWKMNGLRAEGTALAGAMVRGIGASRASVVLCPPATLLSAVAGLLQGSPLHLGGQDCHAAPSGAFTGDISAAMLKDAGCRYVIVGHSERRQHHRETSAEVAAKAAAAHAAGLIAILCVGETEADRQSGKTLEVIKTQLRASLPPSATGTNTVLAYEPVWAIGTGKVATTDDITEVHCFLEAQMKGLPALKDGTPAILYGGSVKPGNAHELLSLSCVDGLLVGGASLNADDFLNIVRAAG